MGTVTPFSFPPLYGQKAEFFVVVVVKFIVVMFVNTIIIFGCTL